MTRAGCGLYGAFPRFLRGGVEAAGALPRAPFRELFEKSSLKTLKNFWERRSKLFCAQRAQDGWRGEGGRTGERVCARVTGGAAGSGEAACGCRESAGAPPRTPFRELFEKSSLKTLKNFSAAGGDALCAGALAKGGCARRNGCFGRRFRLSCGHRAGRLLHKNRR